MRVGHTEDAQDRSRCLTMESFKLFTSTSPSTIIFMTKNFTDQASSFQDTPKTWTDKYLDKDRLSTLPTEILLMIVKNVIPSEGHTSIGYDYFGTNETGIQCESLNMLLVSKSVSEIALQVLYGYRQYELASETDSQRRIAQHDFDSLSFFFAVRSQ